MRIYNTIVLIFLIQASLAQGFRTRHLVPLSSNNSTKVIYETAPGQYVGAGFTIDTSTVVARSQIAMMGLDANGQVQWVKKHHGGSIEYLNNGFAPRCFYRQGNYIYFAGCAHDSDGGNGRQFGVFLKYDLNGDTLWRKIYRSSDSLEDVIPQMVTASVDGGFLMTGFFQHWGNNTNPCLVIKTDANGNELWRKKIGKGYPNVCDGKAILQDSASKKIVIAGYQYIGTTSSFSTYDNLLILDSLGSKLIQTHYMIDGGLFTDMIQTKDSNIVIVGYKNYPQQFDFMAAYAIKISLNDPLSPIWTINGFDKPVQINSFGNIIELANRDVLISGVFDTTGITANRNCLIRMTKINENGSIIANRYYDYKTNSPASDNTLGGNSIELTNDGGWVISIDVVNNPTPNPLFFVKYDSTGCDSTLAYCAFVASGIDELQSASSGSGSGFRVFPNPVSDELFINGHTQPEDNFELTIFDVTGTEEKRTLISSENKINTSDLVPGMYLLQIRQNSGPFYKTKIVKE